MALVVVLMTLFSATILLSTATALKIFVDQARGRGAA
jgi:hypothetical protein